jgi:hypothetical protein
MKRRCAWCGLDMGRKAPWDEDSLTHGICLACSEEVIRSAKREPGGDGDGRCLGREVVREMEWVT